jgi:hypothetical protein
MWNFNPYWPTTPPPGFTGGFSDFEVFLPGDQVGIATTHFSSFYGGEPGEPGSGRGNGPVSITYDSTTNLTTVEFYTSPFAPPADSTLPLGPGPCACGGDNTVPHFGLSAEVPGETTGGELIPPLNMEWTYGSSGTLVVPTVGVGMSSTGDTGQIYYLIEYVAATSGAESGGNYFELPYQGSYTFRFIGSGGPVTLSDAGYFISPTEIPLSDLNLMDEPPTGSPGSPFTPQPHLGPAYTRRHTRTGDLGDAAAWRFRRRRGVAVSRPADRVARLRRQTPQRGRCGTSGRRVRNQLVDPSLSDFRTFGVADCRDVSSLEAKGQAVGAPTPTRSSPAASRSRR